MSKSISVNEAFDNLPLSPYQMGICFLCFAIVFLDGFDLTVIGVAVPGHVLFHDFGIPDQGLREVESVELLAQPLLDLGVRTVKDLEVSLRRAPLGLRPDHGGVLPLVAFNFPLAGHVAHGHASILRCGFELFLL